MSEIAAPTSLESESGVFWRRIAHAAWLSVALGLTLEILVLATVGVFANLPARVLVLAEAVQKTSWSLLVCLGITCGLAVHKARPAAMGALGFVAGPLAFLAAHALQKIVLDVLSNASGARAPALLVAAVSRAVEYGCFGLLLGWISRRPRSTLATYLAGGLAIGLAFQAVNFAVASIQSSWPARASDWIGLELNGILFPVGCACVLYTTQALTRRGPR